MDFHGIAGRPGSTGREVSAAIKKPAVAQSTAWIGVVFRTAFLLSLGAPSYPEAGEDADRTWSASL
jgi:hypothetical protein